MVEEVKICCPRCGEPLEKTHTIDGGMAELWQCTDRPICGEIVRRISEVAVTRQYGRNRGY
jgi:hypothetical protein